MNPTHRVRSIAAFAVALSFLASCGKESADTVQPAPARDYAAAEVCNHIQDVYLAEGQKDQYLCASTDANTGVCTEQYSSLSASNQHCVTQLTRRIQQGRQDEVNCAMHATKVTGIRDCL